MPSVLPHVACISAGSNSLQDLTIPLNQNDMSTLAVPPPSKLEEHACGMAYDGGLLYCSPYIGECMYHKLGTAGWTQPIEMQPGFVTKEPGCAIVGGKLWISGGSPTLGNYVHYNPSCFLIVLQQHSPLPRRLHATETG